MAESKISSKHPILKLVVDGTTDSDGDILVSLDPTSSVPISAFPDRNAGSGYYTSWYTVLLNGRGSGGASNVHSAKIVNDSLQKVSNVKVKFTVYYINC